MHMDLQFTSAPSFTAGQYGINEPGWADALRSHTKTIKSILAEVFSQKQASAPERKALL